MQNRRKNSKDLPGKLQVHSCQTRDFDIFPHICTKFLVISVQFPHCVIPIKMLYRIPGV